jgi:hypothetical protein
MRADVLLLVIRLLRRFASLLAAPGQRRELFAEGRFGLPPPPKFASLRPRSGAHRNLWELIDPYPTMDQHVSFC